MADIVIDKSFVEHKKDDYDMIVLPGGLLGAVSQNSCRISTTFND
jgi:hypothetical protein